MMKKIAIFASGNGSNFQAIYNQIQLGALEVEIGLVVCDKPQAGVVERAKSADIPVFCFVPKEYETKAHFEGEILAALNEYQIDFVILAGYMRLIGSTLLAAYSNRIVNAFPGKDAIEQAFQAGVKVTGVTVHFVDAGMDTGPIIAQQAIEIENGDTALTIAEKIHKVEHALYPKVIQEIVSK
jgi:phosphoribosylglycinamide formyltransferase-1